MSMGNFSKARNVLYTTLAAVTAACSDGIGPPPKPIGAPTASLAMNPPPSRGMYNGNLIFDGRPGTNGEILEGRLDTNGDGQPDMTVAPNQIPFSLQVNKDNRSDSTEAYRYIGWMVGKDGQTGTDTLYLVLAPSNAPTLSALNLPSQVIGRFQENVSTTATPDLGRKIQSIWLDLNLNRQRDTGETTNGNGSTGPLTANGIGNYENNSANTPDTLFFRRETQDNIGRIVRDSSRVIALPYIIINGRITNFENGNPIQATVAAGGSTTSTDINGNYIFRLTQQPDTFLISAPSFQTYLTFLGYSREQGRGAFNLIPSNLIEIINDAVRRGQGTPTIKGPPLPLARLDPSIRKLKIAVYYDPNDPNRFSDIAFADIKDVLDRDLPVYTRFLNLEGVDIEYRTGSPPPQGTFEDGVFIIEPATSSSAGLLINNCYVRAGRAGLTRNAARTVASHELFHLFGPRGHPETGTRSILAWSTQEIYPTYTDSLIVQVNNSERGVCSTLPDNEQRPTSTASSSVYNSANPSANSIRRYNSNIAAQRQNIRRR